MKFKVNDIVTTIVAGAGWKLLIIDINPPQFNGYYKVITLNAYNVDKTPCLYSIFLVDNDYKLAIKDIRKEKIQKINGL